MISDLSAADPILERNKASINRPVISIHGGGFIPSEFSEYTHDLTVHGCVFVDEVMLTDSIFEAQGMSVSFWSSGRKVAQLVPRAKVTGYSVVQVPSPAAPEDYQDASCPIVFCGDLDSREAIRLRAYVGRIHDRHHGSRKRFKTS